MCVIFCKKFGDPSPKNLENFFRTSFANNRDGIGMALKVRDKEFSYVIREKNIELFLEQYRIFKKVIANVDDKDVTYLVHARIGTSGEPTILNVHPFLIDRSPNMPYPQMMIKHYHFGVGGFKSTACDIFAHNGVLSEYSGHHKYCDSLLFSASVLSRIPRDKMDLSKLPYGKFALLTADKNDSVRITDNFVKCQSDGGVLYISNSGCIPKESNISHANHVPNTSGWVFDDRWPED